MYLGEKIQEKQGKHTESVLCHLCSQDNGHTLQGLARPLGTDVCICIFDPNSCALQERIYSFSKGRY